MAPIRLEGVTKNYRDGIVAVSHLDLDVADGRFVVVLGPSGCGKTTVLRLLAGLEEPAEGRIWIDDRLVNNVSPRERDLAMVFQSGALYPHMTVRGNLCLGLKLRGVPKAQIAERVAATASVLGLESWLDRRVGTLSGGQCQRVALGRAMVRRPRAFLFDEPLSNLDAPLRARTRAELKRLHQRLGTTTIYVTHDQEEALSLGEFVAVMRAGVLQQYASPQEVYDRPANRFVAGFVGAPRMNFIEGRLAEGPNGPGFESEAGVLSLPADLASAPSSLGGRRLLLGVRPERLTLGGADPARADDGLLRATVTMTELLGSRSHIHLRTEGGCVLVACVDSDLRVDCGESVAIHLDLRAAQFFDAAGDGPNLCPR